MAIAIALLLLFLIAGGVALRHILVTGRSRAMRDACQANARQLALAMTMYTADYNDRLPVAERWMVLLRPYLQNDQVFICPARPRAPGFAMDKELSLFSVRNIKRPAALPVLFESTIGRRNATDALHAIARRHDGSAYFIYADGHTALVPAQY